MGYTNEDAGDLDKLLDAFRDLTKRFGSVDAILEAFGLADMPTAQRYGIMFGFLVFTCTVTTVICLLIFGGTFKRLAEQAESGDSTMSSSFAARSQRPLLLEHLLDGRERMLSNYPPEPVTEEITNLTKMLLNVAPDPVMEDMGALVETTKNKSTKNENGKKKRYMPPLYQENYLEAYRKCQDRPGGMFMLLFKRYVRVLRCLPSLSLTTDLLVQYVLHSFLHFSFAHQVRYCPGNLKHALKRTLVDMLAVVLIRLRPTVAPTDVFMRPYAVPLTRRTTSTPNSFEPVRMILLANSCALKHSKWTDI